MLLSSLLSLLPLALAAFPQTLASSVELRNNWGSKSPKGFVGREGDHFVLDGKNFYFAGANSYWITQLVEESDVRLTLSSMQKIGIKVLRIWGFGSVTSVPEDDSLAYYQLFENGTVIYNWGENGIQRLDRVVKLAKEYDIKLVWPLVNNWEGYGGMDTAYIGGLLNKNTSQEFHDTFYTNPKINAAYRDWVKLVVNRYKHEDTIFSWQLGNEPRCGGQISGSLNCTTETLSKWIKSESAFIKSLDPHHLVSIGDEGFFNFSSPPIVNDYIFNGQSGLDFNENLKIDTIDYGTFHAYPQSWLELPGDVGLWGIQWIQMHLLSQFVHQKPVVFEEFGVPGYTNASLWLPSWYENAKGLAGIMPWQWGQDGLSDKNRTILYADYILDGFSPNDGYATYPNNTITWNALVESAKYQNAKSV